MNDGNELLPTRRSLLERLRDWNDQESWRVFFETYWKLIYNTAVKAGLTDAEAQDVVQETVISVLKSMARFEYEEGGSFKAWLLRLTRWRIADQLRKRGEGPDCGKPRRALSTRTATIDQVADPAGPALEAAWDREWEANLMEAAVTRVKRKVDSKQYQLFDLYMVKKWPVSRIVRTLRVNPGRVYLAKHRIGKLIKQELEYLRTKPV